MARWVKSIAIILMASQASAADQNASGKAFADQMNGKIDGGQFNMDASAVPGFQAGENAPETSYYGRGSDIEDDALIKSGSSDAYTEVITGDKNRPTYTIKRENDPLFKRYEEISDKSTAIANAGSGCVDLPVGTKDVTVFDDKSCLVNGYQDRIYTDCKESLSLSCSNSNVGASRYLGINEYRVTGSSGFPMKNLGGGRILFGSAKNNRRGRCTWYRNTINFTVPNGWEVYSAVIGSIHYDDWMFIDINGHRGFAAIGKTVWPIWQSPTGNYSCEHKGIYVSQTRQVASRARSGVNTIHVSNLVYGSGNAHFTLSIAIRRKCDVRKTWRESCPSGFVKAGANLNRKSCIAGAQYRNYRGERVYSNCWQYRNTYLSLSEPKYTEEAKCDVLRSEGCGQISSDCLTHHANGFCQTNQLNFQCPRIESARKVNFCAEQVACNGGDCASEYQVVEPVGDDFAKAATTIALVDELAKDFNPNDVSVFKGKPETCFQSDWFGVKKCCSEGGWGVDAGLAQCSNEEKELGEAREAERTHFVGGYKRKDKSAGITTNVRKYQTHCIYPSKLSRVFIEQANIQLGRGYGHAEGPVCTGLSLLELEQLNMDNIDLSEYFDDAVNLSTPENMPDSGSVADRIRDKYKDISK